MLFSILMAASSHGDRSSHQIEHNNKNMVQHVCLRVPVLHHVCFQIPTVEEAAFVRIQARSTLARQKHTTSFRSHGHHQGVSSATRTRSLCRRRRRGDRSKLSSIAMIGGSSYPGVLGRSNSEPEEARRRRRRLVPGTRRRSLVYLAEAVNRAVVEMCVQNEGRPLAAAMTDLVECGVEAFVSGGQWIGLCSFLYVVVC